MTRAKRDGLDSATDVEAEDDLPSKAVGETAKKAEKKKKEVKDTNMKMEAFDRLLTCGELADESSSDSWDEEEKIRIQKRHTQVCPYL